MHKTNKICSYIQLKNLPSHHAVSFPPSPVQGNPMSHTEWYVWTRGRGQTSQSRQSWCPPSCWPGDSRVWCPCEWPSWSGNKQGHLPAELCTERWEGEGGNGWGELMSNEEGMMILCWQEGRPGTMYQYAMCRDSSSLRSSGSKKYHVHHSYRQEGSLNGST